MTAATSLTTPAAPLDGPVQHLLLSYIGGQRGWASAVQSIIEPSARDQLTVLRQFCRSESDYIDAVWGMRQASSALVKRSHAKAWPFRSAAEAAARAALPPAVLHLRRGR